ncbi:MAG: hypothetical protein JWQ87_5587 [Candidatus Sulfotelmatobacter sp.]|nr:hypothetical protein [Candidatus Sulfotelmatobacter sp.]
MLEERRTSQSRQSLLVGVSLLLAAMAALAVYSKTPAPWLQLTSPVVITLSVLWWLRLLYFSQRKASFERRERRRKQYPAARLDIPAGVRKFEQYDGGQTLHEAQWTYIWRAVEAQGNYFASGLLAAILPPLALFLLSSQLLALPTGGSWAIGLILSEISCLVILVFLALTSREPTAEWIENRVRAELFRREQYLLLAGVGPYLFQNSSEAAEEAMRRRGQIEGADAHALVELVPMQERSGLTWLEALHQRGSAKLVHSSDFVERMESYLYYRIGKQLVWFANEIRDIQENEQIWSRLLSGALLAAIAIAAIHAFHLRGVDAAGEADDRLAYWKIAIGTLAIVLPPLGTACLSIRAMYDFRGRSRIYQHEKGLLHTHRGALQALIAEAMQLPVGSMGRDVDKIDFKFRAIVLRTEQSLSVESAQWVLLMERREHEVSP